MEADERAWAELGVYDPDAENASDRLATLRYLAACGATDEEISAALAADMLTALRGIPATVELFRLSRS